METLFSEGGWSAVRESAPLPDGRTKTGIRIYRADSVHVIAFTAPGRILVLREFRPYWGDYVWAIPSGTADKGGDIVEAAQRELQEESGYEAGTMTLLSTANLTDSLTLTSNFFVATDLKKNPLPQDADEMIEVHDLPIEEALEKVLSSPKVHLTSAYALLRYMKENA